MKTTALHLILADDDKDDCNFFKEALHDLEVNAKLTTVNNGVQLMQLLSQQAPALPDALYLDINMPLKNGFDCLSEIKQNEKFKALPVIIFSTSFDLKVVDLLREHGATYYICKPPEFSNLKKIIAKSLDLIPVSLNQQTTKEAFVLTTN